MNVEIFARVSSALRQFLAASPLVGHDCYLHSVLGNDLLRRLGLHTEVVIGYASWRTGAGDFDVVASHPNAHDGDTVNPTNAVCYHCWLQLDAGQILDFTTAQLSYKVAALNVADGRQRTCEWSPDYLLADESQSQSFADVCRGRKPGMFHYERVPTLEARCLNAAVPLPQAEFENAWAQLP